ncbi:MAG: T9SS type A sorting domain-containing protein [Candidatus Kerfeldbacteria bacterium]|nr:T9SS type A sorting domain-containing protein [Candidatus Kerfeldbacteria bacterium]
MRTLFLIILVFIVWTPSPARAWGWLAYAGGAAATAEPAPIADPFAVETSLDIPGYAWRITQTDSGFSIGFGQKNDDVADTAPSFFAPELRVMPNPFRDRALLAFTLPLSGLARLSLVDVRGKVIEALFHEPLTVGSYERVFPANLPAGQYFLRLIVNDKQTTIKVVVLH